MFKEHKALFYVNWVLVIFFRTKVKVKVQSDIETVVKKQKLLI
jgi:hypothetical protein